MYFIKDLKICYFILFSQKLGDEARKTGISGPFCKRGGWETLRKLIRVNPSLLSTRFRHFLLSITLSKSPVISWFVFGGGAGEASWPDDWGPLSQNLEFFSCSVFLGLETDWWSRNNSLLRMITIPSRRCVSQSDSKCSGWLVELTGCEHMNTVSGGGRAPWRPVTGT